MLNNAQINEYAPMQILDMEDSIKNKLSKYLDGILLVVKALNKDGQYSHYIENLENCRNEMNKLHSILLKRPLTDIEKHLEEYNKLLATMQQNLTHLSDKIPQQSAIFNKINKGIDGEKADDKFLHKPTSLKETQWLVDYRFRQVISNLQQQQEKSPEQLAMRELLLKIQSNLNAYQPGHKKDLRATIDLIEKFKIDHPEIYNKNQPWLGNVAKECRAIKNKAIANRLQEQRDVIEIELQSDLNKAQHKYDEYAKSIKRDYDKFKFKPKVGILSKPINFINKTIDNYIEDKLRIPKLELKLEVAKIKKSHKSKFEKTLKIIAEEEEKLNQEGVSLPTSFNTHQNISRLINQNEGMIIGGLAQAKINTLGTQGGLCYGFTKNWILEMNGIANNEVHEIIDKLDLYTNNNNINDKGKEKNKDKHLISKVNNLLLNNEVFKAYNEQKKDKVNQVGIDNKSKDFKFMEKKPLNEQFPSKIFEALNKANPNDFPKSVIVLINAEKGGHALGVVQTKHGIWFHDSNSACVFFPNNPNCKDNFSNFFNEYKKQYYGNYTNGSFMPITKVKEESKLVAKADVKEDNSSVFNANHSLLTNYNKQQHQPDQKSKVLTELQPTEQVTNNNTNINRSTSKSRH